MHHCNNAFLFLLLLSNKKFPPLFMQCFGVMEGVNYSDLIAEGKLAGVKSVLHYTPPGAETIEEFDSRAMSFFCEICKYVDYYCYVANMCHVQCKIPSLGRG